MTLALAGAVLALAGLCSRLAANDRNGPQFRLIDQDGRSVTEKMLGDKPTVLHFGFTHCPVVCPTTLVEISERLRELGPVSQEIRFVFVTVDPERDTPELLKGYLASFDTRIVGLTGSADQIQALATGLGASVTRQALADGSYSVDHSVFAYLMSRGWSRAGVLYMGSDSRAERVLSELRRLIARP